MPLPEPEVDPTPRRRALRVVAVALPALVTLIVGLTHPVSLTASSAEWWRDLHITLLPVFPLIGAAPWITSRGTALPWRWVAGLGGFLFAVYYTALDVLAGIAAGSEQLAGHPEGEHTLFAIADVFGPIGAAGLAVGWVAATVAAVRHSGPRALVGLLGVVGALLVWKSHVYFPLGTLGLALLVIGGAALALLSARPTSRAA